MDSDIKKVFMLKKEALFTLDSGNLASCMAKGHLKQQIPFTMVCQLTLLNMAKETKNLQTEILSKDSIKTTDSMALELTLGSTDKQLTKAVSRMASGTEKANGHQVKQSIPAVTSKV